MCDCTVSRILTDGPSEVIDVGRATRTVGIARWNALVARDRHCTESGCVRGPGDCEAHHIVHWSKGGPTTLDNLKLLCWEHHRQQHIRDAIRQGRRPPTPPASPSTTAATAGTKATRRSKPPDFRQ